MRQSQATLNVSYGSGLILAQHVLRPATVRERFTAGKPLPYGRGSPGATRKVHSGFLSLLIAFFACASPIAAAEDKPASAPESAFTGHEYNRQLLELNRRTLSGAYKQVGKHGPWDQAATKFLDKIAVYFTYGPRSGLYQVVEVPSHEELVKSGRAAVAAGCKDPVVSYCLGAALQDSGQLENALPHLRAAPSGLRALKYPDYHIWSAARRLYAAEPGTEHGREAKKIAEERIVRMACGKLQPIERREMLLRLREHMNFLERKDQVKLVERLRSEPHIDPWVIDALDGGLQIDLAWDSRGIELADKVPEEGWAGHFEHLKKAQEQLTRAWKVAPDLPEPAASMITVAMGGGEQLGEDPRIWFDRAVAAQLDYGEAYDKMSWALLPHWGGSHAEMYEVGLRGARTKRFDTDAPWQLVHVVRLIVGNVYGNWPAVLSRPGIYDQLVEVADAYAKFHKDKPRLANWYRTFNAALAWRAEKYAAARRIMRTLHADADLDAFKVVNADNPSLAIGQLFAFSSAQADDVRRGEAAAAQREWAAAIAAFEAARAAVPKAPTVEAEVDDERATRWYLDNRLALYNRRLDLANGKLVDCQPNAALDGWKQFFGHWRVAEDGTLIGAMSSSAMPYLELLEDIGTRYEISGQTNYTGRVRPVVMLLAETPGGRDFGYIALDDDSIELYHLGEDVKPFMKEINSRVNFVVRYDDGVLNVRIDGKPLVENFAVPGHLRQTPGISVGILSKVHGGGVGTALFRDLKIRRLGKDEPPLQPEEQAAKGS